MTKRIWAPLLAAAALTLTGCGGEESATEEPTVVVTKSDTPDTKAAEIPDKPQTHSSLMKMGDASALPVGTDGEVTIVALSAPTNGSSFPFIVHNRTDKPISRIEVSGRAKGPDGATLGSGTSQSIHPNFVLPGGYAIGYIYVETSDFEVPAGSTVEDPRIQYTDGLGEFENIIGLDLSDVEQLPNGDIVGDVTNPHEITVAGPVDVAAACLTPKGTVIHRSTFTDSDTVPANDSVTWTISSYGENPTCAVQLIGADGYED